MNWPAYPEYMRSGVEWLGNVPKSWSIAPVRAAMYESDVRNDGEADTNYLSLMANIGVIPYAEKGDVGNKKPEDLSKCKVVKRDDFVINSMNYQIGSYGVSKYDGVCSPVYIILQHRPELVELRFALRIFETRSFQKYAQSFGNGILEHRRAISWDTLKGLRIAVPPIIEQQKLLAFLDRETAKIDALIGRQNQLIATLREDRTATITHAVTKGLDPDAAMKDSGVEWIGYIPRSWEIVPFLWCISSQVDYRGATPTKTDDGVLLVTARNVRPGLIDYETSREYVSPDEYQQVMRRGLPEIGDLLFTMEAPLGNVALVDRTDIALAQRIIKFRADAAKSSAQYLLYSTIGEWFQAQIESRATGSTALGLKASKLPELRIALPSLDDQQVIVNYLDAQCARMDRLIEKATEVIATLREYRSALITAAVTGKIDVREAA